MRVGKTLSVLGVSFLLAGCVATRSETAVHSSSILAEASLPDIAARSEAIVTGRVIAVRPSRWNREHDDVYTDSIFGVTTWVKGSGPDRITIRRSGGTIGGITYHSDSTVALPLNQELLLFLELEFGTTMDLDGQFFVSGGPQGAYELDVRMARGLVKPERWISIEELLNIARGSR